MYVTAVNKSEQGFDVSWAFLSKLMTQSPQTFIHCALAKLSKYITLEVGCLHTCKSAKIGMYLLASVPL